MLLLLLLWCAGQVGGHGVPQCDDKYEYIEKKGHLTGRISVPDPGGALNMSVTVAFKLAGADTQDTFGGMRMKEDNTNQTRMLRYYVKFPVRSPPPKITSITFNNRVICITEASPYEANFFTSFAHAMSGRNRKPASSHSIAASGSSSSEGPRATNDFSMDLGLDSYSIPTYVYLPFVYTHPPQRPHQRRMTTTSGHPTTQTTTSQPLQTEPPPSKKPPTTEGQDEEYCGLSVRPQTLMLRSREVENGDWPWVAALYEVQNDVFKCAGVLVGKRFVVIAAHCVIDPVQQTKVKEDGVVLIMGKFDFAKWAEREMQAREVRRIILHPDFSVDPLTNDIALLYLVDDVDYTMFARPICLWDDEADIATLVNQVGTVIGWNPMENLPRRALVPIASYQDCVASFGQLADRTFCAGNTTASKHCIGNGDGSLLLPKVDDNGNVRWFLRGIPSSPRLNNPVTCVKGGYVVYTDAARFVAWIRDVMRTTKPYHE